MKSKCLSLNEDIPAEAMAEIFMSCDLETLLSARLVCSYWKSMIDGLWKRRLKEKQSKGVQHFLRDDWILMDYPINVYYTILKHDPFGKNLLKNNCGQLGLEHWVKKTARDVWHVEAEPLGCNPLPQDEDFAGHRCCFVTSYTLARKHQIINLRDYGISTVVLDQLRPTVVVSEWVACRFDCHAMHKLSIKLCTRDRNIVSSLSNDIQLSKDKDTKWQKVVKELNKYGSGVSTIIFSHEGKDRQFWAGNYGSKMAGSVVKLILPKPSEMDRDQDENVEIDETIGRNARTKNSDTDTDEDEEIYYEDVEIYSSDESLE